MKFCAIDLGATSGRVLIGSRESSCWVIDEIHRFDHYLVESKYGLIWDVHQIETEILGGLKKIKTLGYTIDSIGIDTWAVDYVLLDQDEQPLLPVFAYRNHRNAVGVSRVSQKISSRDVYKKTGIQFQPFNTLYQLASETGDKLLKAKTFLMLPDYLNFVLTGKKTNEYSNLTTTALLNCHTGQLDTDLLDMISVKKELFPPLLQPGSIIGNLKHEVVKAIGYDCMVVSVASHDTASAFIGHSNDDALILSSGTWSLMGLILRKPIITEDSYQLNLSNEGGVQSTIRFLKNIMGLWIFSEIKRLYAADVLYSDLIEQTEKHPSEMIIDVNDESLLSPQDMLEAVNQLIEAKYSKRLKNLYDVLYVVFNSLADSYSKTMTEIERVVGRTYDNLVIVGGGSQNQLLNRLIEVKSGKKVILGPVESTAIGNMKIQEQVIHSII